MKIVKIIHVRLRDATKLHLHVAEIMQIASRKHQVQSMV